MGPEGQRGLCHNHSLVLDRCLYLAYAVQASQSLRPGDPANPLPVSPTASLALWLYGCKSLCPGFHSCLLGISQGGDTSSLSCPQAQTWPEETTLLTPSTLILLFFGIQGSSRGHFGPLSPWHSGVPLVPPAWVLTPTVPFPHH